ncbi:hypothetical protein, partial [Klebsiella pneumoniae]|uniref:hypothetical protein n=1 Tax=Klebsiella pneumoniae TaxID=573 RepID=UPI00338DF67D
MRCSVPPSVGGKVPHVRWVRIGNAGAETLYDSENASADAPQVSRGEEEFSIIAHNLTSEHSGHYSCLVGDDHNQERSLSVRLLVGERRLSGNRFHPSVKDISPYCFTHFPESC